VKKIFLFLGVVAISTAAISVVSWAQSEERPEILVVGTYHMANPGHDLHNTEADDVLTPKRQQDMVQLIEVLKRFHPTKIAIEADIGSKKVEQEYSDYLAGKYTLSRNETNQLGYRLAKELGHHSIYPVDEEGDFPYGRLLNYVKANGLKDKFDAQDANVREQGPKELDLQSHTILEKFEDMNSDAQVAKGVAWYFACVHYGDPYDYAGPDLVAAWYERNIRIYHNIVALIDSPKDRILVIYGAGHLGWLQQDIANDPSVKLRKLSDLTAQH
jgi:hypothetical protein